MTTLTVNQAAARLNLCTKTIYDLVNAGTIPAYKSGRVWRIDEAEMLSALRYVPQGRSREPDPMPRPTRSTFDDELAKRREERRRRVA